MNAGVFILSGVWRFQASVIAPPLDQHNIEHLSVHTQKSAHT